MKLLPKFQSNPCNHVEVISSPRVKKVVSRKTRLKFEVQSLKGLIALSGHSEALRENLSQSLFQKCPYYKTKCILFLWY